MTRYDVECLVRDGAIITDVTRSRRSSVVYETPDGKVEYHLFKGASSNRQWMQQALACIQQHAIENGIAGLRLQSAPAPRKRDVSPKQMLMF